jgi:hypothetical protein
MVDSGSFRDYLWERLPESRPVIQQIEADATAEAEEYGSEFFVGVYGYVSEVYWWEVFEPALQQDDRALVARCLEVCEAVLSGSDDLLKEAFGIRVLPHLLSWHNYTKGAGPCLVRELAAMAEE